jgi:hypothetical protein
METSNFRIASVAGEERRGRFGHHVDDALRVRRVVGFVKRYFGGNHIFLFRARR